MPINYLSVGLAAFLLGVLLIIIFKDIALRYRILTLKQTPLVGGAAMGLAFILSCLAGIHLFRNLPQEVIGIVIASAIMLAFGMLDDWRELSVAAKFAAQLIATAILILSGIRTRIIYIGDPLNIMITFIWVVGITNAFNHLDIIDGLAAACALIAGISFFGVAFLNGDARTAILSLLLTGAILSCFIYNLPPARIYMGNTGSHFLGFTLAAVALAISYAPAEKKIALLSPLLILGLPILDTGLLILLRAIKRRSVFRKSNDHLALRFVKLGHSRPKTLFIMSILAVFFSVSGLLLSQVPARWGMVVVSEVVLVSAVVAYRMGRVQVDDG